MSVRLPAVERLTPGGVGGVAVLAVRSGAALCRLEALFGRALPGSGRVAYGVLAEPEARGETAPVDEVLLVGREGRVVEVHMHGSPAVVAEVVALLDDPDDPVHLRSLEERAEAAAALAASATGARILLDQADGALRSALEALLDGTPGQRASGLAVLAARGLRRAPLWTPTTVAIVGPVNVGKSTLFNALAGEELAAVTDVPGTTRDALGARVHLGPWPVVLVDTAGERELGEAVAAGDRAAEVERAGQQLARIAAARAGLVLDLVDSSSALADLLEQETDQSGPPRVRLRAQAARSVGSDPEGWGPRTISALEAPAHAREVVAQAFADHLDPGPRDEALWSPGQAVPFERELLDRLFDLATSGSVERSALASVLEGL